MFKGLLHTTESMRYTPSVSSYYGHQSWPHFTAYMDTSGRARLVQHIPIDRAARALKNLAGGVQTNREPVVQIEIAWVAAEAERMPQALEDMVAQWMRWVEFSAGVVRKARKFYGRDAGWTLASVNAPQRMSFAEWEAWDGWCGHQHAPENTHWDPGNIDIAYLLAAGAASTGDWSDMATREEIKAVVLEALQEWMVGPTAENKRHVQNLIFDTDVHTRLIRDSTARIEAKLNED